MDIDPCNLAQKILLGLTHFGGLCCSVSELSSPAYRNASYKCANILILSFLTCSDK